MKDAHAELELEWGSILDGVAQPGSRPDAYDTNREDYVENSPKALEVMRAYIGFMDEEIMRDYQRFEKLDETSNATTSVRFSDLWYLFRTGELIYRQIEGDSPDHRDFRTGKRILEASDRAVADEHDATFVVGVYYIDYTGDEFCVVTKQFKIPPYVGEVPISLLPIVPIRFCPNHKDRIEHARQSGEDLTNFIEAKHCLYNGWTLTRTLQGELMTDNNGSTLQYPEHINSEVMVDFTEAFQRYPQWRPKRELLKSRAGLQSTASDGFAIRWWTDKQRTTLLGETTEVIPIRTGITTWQRNTFISNNPFLMATIDNAKSGTLTDKKYLTEEEKVLLTGRVFAYVFQERKFSQLAVLNLKKSARTTDALDSLKIPEETKRAIQGSVQGHFLQKQIKSGIDPTWLSLDLIQSKGMGLFILLHGYPGVGKTATAEATAQANGKPLFKITVGDLGMTPDKVEESLRHIFRLASIWDCILLLDEVDTFFSSRSIQVNTMKKNALVSVFLRVLDYYNGILFLTTNRTWTLDEAFTSRIHYMIYYPPLSRKQTMDIWEMNIKRMHKIEEDLSKVEKRPPMYIDDKALLEFAGDNFDKSQSGRWNGRQIRNAFQVARSFAYSEHHQNKKPGAALVLDVSSFRKVHDITTSFTNYLASIHDRKSDSEIALESGGRNDRYKDKLTFRYDRQSFQVHPEVPSWNNSTQNNSSSQWVARDLSSSDVSNKTLSGGSAVGQGPPNLAVPHPNQYHTHSSPQRYPGNDPPRPGPSSPPYESPSRFTGGSGGGGHGYGHPPRRDAGRDPRDVYVARPAANLVGAIFAPRHTSWEPLHARGRGRDPSPPYGRDPRDPRDFSGRPDMRSPLIGPGSWSGGGGGGGRENRPPQQQRYCDDDGRGGRFEQQQRGGSYQMSAGSGGGGGGGGKVENHADYWQYRDRELLGQPRRPGGLLSRKRKGRMRGRMGWRGWRRRRRD